MRYISNDNKVFNTEEECLEHENSIKMLFEEQQLKKKQFEEERKKMLKEINEEYNDLHTKISEFEKKFGSKQRVNFVPFYEIMDMLCI